MKQIERGFLEEYEEKSQIFYFIILAVLIILLRSSFSILVQ